MYPVTKVDFDNSHRLDKSQEEHTKENSVKPVSALHELVLSHEREIRRFLDENVQYARPITGELHLLNIVIFDDDLETLRSFLESVLKEANEKII